MARSAHTSSDTLTAIADYLAAGLLGFLFLPVFILVAELFARTSFLKWELPLIGALLSPLLCLPLLKHQSLKTKIIAVLLLLCALAKALFIASLFYDNTWDGRAYHADGILLLLDGSNPIYEMMHGFDDLWTNNYPKATWYFSAVIDHAGHNYNLGKCYNLLLMYAAFACVFSFLKRRGLSTGNALLAALAMAAGPVTVDQLHCFYVDGALASLFTIILFATLSMLHQPRTADKIIFLTAACLLINVKFTGAAYLAVICGLCAATLVVRWLKNRTQEDFAYGRNFAGLLLLTGLVGGLFMGFNPYVTNILVHKNVLYPLSGTGSIDIIAAQNPKSFNENHSGVVKNFLVSAFSRTANIADKGGTAEPVLKIPFTVSKKETSLFFASDVRIGGWGVLFSGALTLAFLLYLGSGSWKDREMGIALLAVLITILINPGSWWARYAPQAALLPLLIATACLTSQVRWQRICAQFICVIMLLNSALILPANTGYFIETSRKIQQQIDAMIAACGRGAYQMSDPQGYHYDQFLLNNGITVTYPRPDITKTHSKAMLFPLQEVFLYKEGCVRH